jgi:hypothetical protein
MISLTLGVVEDRLEHTQPDRLVDHAPHQLVAFARRQDDALAGDEVGDDALEPGPSLVGIDLAELVEVDLLEEHAPEGDDEAVVLLGRRGDGPAGEGAVVVHLITGIVTLRVTDPMSSLTTVGSLTVTE